MWTPTCLSSCPCLQTPRHGPTGTWGRTFPALPRVPYVRQGLRSRTPGLGLQPPSAPGHHRAAAGCQGGAGRWESGRCQSGRCLSKLGRDVGPGASSAESQPCPGRLMLGLRGGGRWPGSCGERRGQDLGLMTLTLTGAEHSRAHQAGACVRETRGPLAPWVCGLTLPADPETRAALCLWGSTPAPPTPTPQLAI